VNVVIGFAVVIAITAITITAMLLVRKRAPAGSYFSDADPASDRWPRRLRRPFLPLMRRPTSLELGYSPWDCSGTTTRHVFVFQN
jgi:hypothetical protein